MDIKNLNEVPAFITVDGSEIRELLAHRNSAIRNQSLAEARIPVGRLGKAEAIARGVLFLVADDAGFITGSTMSINGGQHMY